jgi:hypothetical protein
MRRTAAAAIAVACVCAAVFAQGGRARPAVVLSVVSCPTSFGFTPSAKDRRQPTTRLTVAAPGAVESKLTVYALRWHVFLAVLAPHGWHCTGGIGADGNAGVSVLPPRVARVTPKSPAVTAYWYLNGVAATEACPFFPNHYTGICPRIPARERVTRASRHSIRFEDPPRVKGNGYPSGGSLPANGALIARPQTNTTPYATDIATCTLPQSQQPLCTAILNDFLTRYRL